MCSTRTTATSTTSTCPACAASRRLASPTFTSIRRFREPRVSCSPSVSDSACPPGHGRGRTDTHFARRGRRTSVVRSRHRPAPQDVPVASSCDRFGGQARCSMGRMRTLTTSVLLCILAVAATEPAAAQQDRPTAEKTLSPYFFVDGDPAVDRLPLKDTRVDVAISGVIADVSVRQIYENRGQRPLHARYVFPASTRAAVYGMTMTVGDVRIVAKIK